MLSWLSLGGRCARCRKPISVLHPLSELSLGIAFACGIAFAQGDFSRLLLYLLVVLFLYLFALYDIMHRIVPNKLVLLGLVTWGLLLITGVSTDFPTSMSIWDRLGGAVAFSGVFVFVNLLTYSGLFPGVEKGKQGFGWGDAKLGLLLGLILGWPLVNAAFWVAVLGGALVGVAIYAKVRKRYVQVPFVPFLAIGSWVALMWGGDMIEWFSSMLLIS